MRNYKYNELDYAELIYNKGFQTKHIPTELRLVATYIKTILELKPKQLKIQMYDFCSKNIPEYNRARYYKIINKALNQAKKKTSILVKIESICIYDYEVDYINSLEIFDENNEISKYDYECKKVIFALLCQMKLNKAVSKIKSGKESKGIYFKGGNKKYNELKAISKISSVTRVNEDIIYTLGKNGIVDIMFNGLIKLNFMQSIDALTENIENKNIVISITDFDTIGLYFDYYNKKPKMKLCEYCKQPFKQTKSNITYCEKHKGYQPVGEKTIKCIDCGEDVEVDAKANNRNRCDKCIADAKREKYRKYNKKRKKM